MNTQRPSHDQPSSLALPKASPCSAKAKVCSDVDLKWNQDEGWNPAQFLVLTGFTITGYSYQPLCNNMYNCVKHGLRCCFGKLQEKDDSGDEPLQATGVGSGTLIQQDWSTSCIGKERVKHS